MIGDLFLTRSDGEVRRCYSVSAQIQRDRKCCYDIVGKLTSSKWAAMTNYSPDTALRDITERGGLGVLEKDAEGEEYGLSHTRGYGFELGDAEA